MGQELPLHWSGTKSDLEKLADEFVAKLKSRVGEGRLFSTDSVDGPPLNRMMFAQTIIKRRRERERLLGADLFSDPVWDMMLDLFVSARIPKRVSVSSLCIAATVPATTALRHLKVMESRGIVIRTKDHLDQRRLYISLTAEWDEKIDQLLGLWSHSGRGAECPGNAATAILR